MHLRRVLAGAVAAIAAAAAASHLPAGAAPQEPAASREARASASEAHRLRGALAWRRAVWTGDRDLFTFAARELEQALRSASSEQGPRDFAGVFLLAASRLWRGDVAGAQGPAREARELLKDFPGHILLDAVASAPEPRGPDWKKRFRAAVGTLEKFQVALASYDRTAPFAGELEYLGHFELGVRLYWLDQFDRAILEFDRATQIARAAGRTPGPELVRRTSQCHKSLHQFELSERMIHESLERDPGEPSHYQVLGQLAADRERRKEARAWYERALARKQDYAEPRAKLAYIARDEDDLYAMRVHLEAYRAIHESRWATGRQARDPQVEANIHSGFGHYWFKRAEELADARRFAEARGFYLEARRELEAAIAKEPGCIGAMTTLIQVLYQLGEPVDSGRPYEQKIEDMRKEEPGMPAPYGDTFCRLPGAPPSEAFPRPPSTGPGGSPGPLA